MDFKIFLNKYLELNPEKESVVCNNNAYYTYIYLGDILNTSTFDDFKYTLKDVYLIIPNNLDKSKFSMFREKVDVRECSNYWSYLEHKENKTLRQFNPAFSGFVHFNSTYKSFCFSPFVVEAIDEFKERLSNIKNSEIEKIESEEICDYFDMCIEQFYNFFSISSHDNHRSSSEGGDYQRGCFKNNSSITNNERCYVKHYNILNGQKIPTVISNVITTKKVASISNEFTEVLDVTDRGRYKLISFKNKPLKTFLIEHKENIIITTEIQDYPVNIKLIREQIKNEKIAEYTNNCFNKPIGTFGNFYNQLTDQFCRVDGGCSI